MHACVTHAKQCTLINQPAASIPRHRPRRALLQSQATPWAAAGRPAAAGSPLSGMRPTQRPAPSPPGPRLPRRRGPAPRRPRSPVPRTCHARASSRTHRPQSAGRPGWEGAAMVSRSSAGGPVRGVVAIRPRSEGQLRASHHDAVAWAGQHDAVAWAGQHLQSHNGTRVAQLPALQQTLVPAGDGAARIARRSLAASPPRRVRPARQAWRTCAPA